MFELRPFQQQAVAEIRAAYAAGFKAPLLVSPTGSGKTVLFSYVAQQAALKGNNILILVHRKELIRQTSKTLGTFGVSHGVIAPGYPPTGDRVQVASVQTLVRRLHKITWKPNMIIQDECHHGVKSSTWGKVIDHYADVPLLGVTATPERLDGRGLGLESDGFFDRLIMGPSFASLVDQGFLSQPVVYGPPNAPDLSGVHTRAGDFSVEELEGAMSKSVITGDAVEHYRKYCNNGPAIAFCTSIKHAHMVADEFQAAGMQAASIDGKLNDDDRQERLDDLSSGKLNVLTSCEIVSEGFDAPVVSAAILLRPTQSLGLALQQMGRAARPYPGKTQSIILDHAGNCHRHGLPDDDRTWSLSAAPRRKRSPADPDAVKIKQCKNCYYVHKPAPKCPSCGYVYIVEERKIKVVKGDLEKMARREARTQERESQTYGDLIKLAKARGYKNPWGWASKRCVARAKTLPQMIAVGQSMGRKDPVKWAEFMFEKREAEGQK